MPGLRRSGSSSRWQRLAGRIRNVGRRLVGANIRRRGLGYQVGRSIYRKAPQVELKAYDVPDFTQALRTPAAATALSPPLNIPTNGPELYQRVGRKIYMKSIQIRGYVWNAATTTSSLGRVILLYDSQANGAAPVVADILSNMTLAPATTGCSMLNLNNRQRFSILKDVVMNLPSCTNVAGVLTNGPSYPDTTGRFEINWFVKLRGLEAVFNNVNGGNIGDVASGSLFLMFITDVNDATWNFKGVTRLRYYD